MLSPRAYLAIEGTLADWAIQEWRRYARKQAAELHRALRTYNYPRAHEIADSLSFEGLIASSGPALEKAGIMASVFGRARSGVPSSAAPLWSDFRARQFKNWFAASLRYNGAEFVKDSAQRIVAAAKLRDKAIPFSASDLDEVERFQRLLNGRTAFKAARLTRATERRLIEMETEEEYINALGDALGSAIVGEGEAYVGLAANLYASRVASFAFLSEQVASDYKTYQISSVLDDVRCRFCRGVHGRVFKVDPAADRMQQWLGYSDTPDAAALVAPWPPQTREDIEYYSMLTNRELQELGYDTPPFHPLCRCIVVPTGTVERDEENGEFFWSYAA